MYQVPYSVRRISRYGQVVVAGALCIACGGGAAPHPPEVQRVAGSGHEGFEWCELRQSSHRGPTGAWVLAVSSAGNVWLALDGASARLSQFLSFDDPLPRERAFVAEWRTSSDGMVLVSADVDYGSTTQRLTLAGRSGAWTTGGGTWTEKEGKAFTDPTTLTYLGDGPLPGERLSPLVDCMASFEGRSAYRWDSRHYRDEWVGISFSPDAVARVRRDGRHAELVVAYEGGDGRHAILERTIDAAALKKGRWGHFTPDQIELNGPALERSLGPFVMGIKGLPGAAQERELATAWSGEQLPLRRGSLAHFLVALPRAVPYVELIYPGLSLERFSGAVLVFQRVVGGDVLEVPAKQAGRSPIELVHELEAKGMWYYDQRAQRLLVASSLDGSSERIVLCRLGQDDRLLESAALITVDELARQEAQLLPVPAAAMCRARPERCPAEPAELELIPIGPARDRLKRQR